MRNTKNQLFQVYDFREEYGNSPDRIKHIIATDLTVEEAIKELAEAGIDIEDLKPFILLPLGNKEVFNEAFRNEKKHERRNCLYGEFHGYEDGVLNYTIKNAQTAWTISRKYLHMKRK